MENLRKTNKRGGTFIRHLRVNCLKGLEGYTHFIDWNCEFLSPNVRYNMFWKWKPVWAFCLFFNFVKILYIIYTERKWNGFYLSLKTNFPFDLRSYFILSHGRRNIDANTSLIYDIDIHLISFWINFFFEKSHLFLSHFDVIHLKNVQ